MSDTAQSVVTADPNAQIAAAANAFKTAIVDPVMAYRTALGGALRDFCPLPLELRSGSRGE